MKRQASHNEALKNRVFMKMLASVKWKGWSWQTAGKSCCPGDSLKEAWNLGSSGLLLQSAFPQMTAFGS